MRSALTLALITLLCTCGRAQAKPDKLPRDVTNIAFIKGETGFLIDSLTVRTTLDTVPYGFDFPEDTLYLDISIFDPLDELTLETFAGEHTFGLRSCWVDAPTANVYLSVQAGRNVIDSVGLSPVDRLFRREIAIVQAQANPANVKASLLSSMDLFSDTPIAADLQAAYLDMFTLSRADIRTIWLNLQERPGPAKRHPWFKEPDRKLRLMNSNMPGRLSKYELKNPSGEPAEIEVPKGQYYVLNFYDSKVPTCKQNHQLIAKVLATDSLFTGVPMISVSSEQSAKGWSEYVRTGAYSWPHYHEPKTAKKKLSEKMQLYPTGTYVLINEGNLIEGVYGDLVKLAAALAWRRKKGML